MEMTRYGAAQPITKAADWSRSLDVIQ